MTLKKVSIVIEKDRATIKEDENGVFEAITYSNLFKYKTMESKEAQETTRNIKLTPQQIDEEVMRKYPYIEREKECMTTKHQRQYDRNVYKAELLRENQDA